MQGKVEVVLEELRDVAYAAKPGKRKGSRQLSKQRRQGDVFKDPNVTIKTEGSVDTGTATDQCDTDGETGSIDNDSFDRALKSFKLANSAAASNSDNEYDSYHL